MGFGPCSSVKGPSNSFSLYTNKGSSHKAGNEFEPRERWHSTDLGFDAEKCKDFLRFE